MSAFGATFFSWQQQTQIIPCSGDCRVFASIELCTEIFGLACSNWLVFNFFPFFKQYFKWCSFAMEL